MSHANVGQFFNENKCRMLLTIAVAGGFSLFITGLMLLYRGRLIPPGEVYNCTSTDFSMISQNRDPDEFYQQLQSCAFLAQCAVNITLMVCQRQCTHFFVSEPVSNDVIVRTCPANRDIGLGTIVTVWGGVIVFSFLAYLACCMPDFVQGVRSCCSSFKDAFFASSEDEVFQESRSSLTLPV